MQDSIRRIKSAIQYTAKSYDGGARALGTDIGCNPTSFTNKCNPTHESKLTFNETIRVIKQSGNRRILEVVSQELGYVCLAAEDANNLVPTDIMKSWANWNTEHGDFSGVYAKSLEDKEVTSDEYDQVHQQMYEEFSCELQLLLLVQEYVRGSNDCTILSAIEAHKSIAPIDEEMQNLVASFTGGMPEICQLLSINKGTLERKLDENDESLELNLFEIITLLRASEQHGLLLSLANYFDCYCISIMDAIVTEKDEDVLYYWSKREIDRGETAELIHEVIYGEDNDCDIFVKICQEVFDDFSHGKTLLTHLGLLVK